MSTATLEQKQIKRRVRRPKRHMDGKYSEYDGVDFDLKEGLWSSSVNGIVINYSITEKEALMKRTVFVDIILDKFDTAEDEFDEELLNKIKATDFEELFADLSDEDLKDSTNLSLKEVKKELIKF